MGFLCYLTAAIAETNRIPFDLPEAETELVAGFHTEYSSFKFAMFFMAEYANMITVSCLATILFFGGWLSPFPDSWTWQLYLPGAGLVLLGMYCAYDTVVNMRGIAKLQFAVVTHAGLVGGAICLIPCGGAGDSGAILVHHQGDSVPVLLCLDARHASPLPLRPADVLRLEVAAAGVAGESGGHELRADHPVSEARMSVPFLVFFACAFLAVLGAVLLILVAGADSQRAFADPGDDVARRCSICCWARNFIAAVQIIVYAGAIMVLFVFVIMLLNAGTEERTELEQDRQTDWAAAGVSFSCSLIAHWLFAFAR